MIVMKFGGTSVGDASCFRQVADIIGSHQARTPVVVVSAMSGVTNSLLSLARQAEKGDTTAAGAGVGELMARHQAAIDGAIGAGDERRSAAEAVTAYGRELASILTGVSLVRECTARTLDAVAAYGEKMSATILAAVLRAQNHKARYLTAEDLIVTDDNHGQAVPLPAESRRRIVRRIPAVLKRGETPVITGFIARSTAGATTTLSRGGSDYSASLIASALGAEELWIWTDVDGVMTADPRAVPQARVLSSLTYAEAAELSYFGAKVLHPKTIAPAVGKGIPVWIKNTFNPTYLGTLVAGGAGQGAGNGSVVKAVTSMPGMSMVTVQGAGMIGVPGIAARVFAAVAASGASVLMISQSSSEYNISFVVSKDWSQKVMTALRREFALELQRGDVSDIWSQEGAILAAVGAGMRGTPGVAGRLFSALGRSGINVIAIAQGSSELNISLVVAEEQRIAALRCLHSEFIA